MLHSIWEVFLIVATFAIAVRPPTRVSISQIYISDLWSASITLVAETGSFSRIFDATFAREFK